MGWNMPVLLGKPYSIYNISGKLNRDTLKYSEVKILYDILGYELVLRKNKCYYFLLNIICDNVFLAA